MAERTRKPGKSAWVIYWDWCGDEKAVGNRVVAVLNYRYGGESVRRLVEILYRNSFFFCPSDKLRFALNRSHAYEAEFVRIDGILWMGWVHCGHNPWLVAQFVRDLTITVDENGDEEFSWDESIAGDILRIREMRR